MKLPCGIVILVINLGVSFAAKHRYDQSCKQLEDCEESLGLSCQNNACKCALGGETVYSPLRRRCVGAAGRECLRFTNETLCVENSECQNYEYMHLCACKDNYYQGRDGNCYNIAKYGESCREEDFSCGDSMTTAVSCVEKKCRCLLGEDNQYYDPKEKKCTSYAGGHCLYHYSQSCALNSKCDSIYENINGALFHVGHKCLCEPGYTYTRSRHCLPGFGADCNATKSCNYDNHLGCLNGKCQCRNALHEIYNEKTGQCALLVGSACKTNEGPKCVENSSCGSSGKCECNKSYSVTLLNTCLVDIGQRCETNECNYFSSLTCINGTCQCIDSNLKYEKETKGCVSMNGFPCGTVSIYEDREKTLEIYVSCEANSTCVEDGYSGYANNKRVCKSSSSKN